MRLIKVQDIANSPTGGFINVDMISHIGVSGYEIYADCLGSDHYITIYYSKNPQKIEVMLNALQHFLLSPTLIFDVNKAGI